MRLEEYEIAATYLKRAHQINSHSVAVRMAINELKRKANSGPRRKRKSGRSDSLDCDENVTKSCSAREK